MNNLLEEININNENSLINNITEEIGKSQKNFLNSNFGNIINSAIDLGIRVALPDLIENQIIDAKNIIIEEGWQEGLNSIIESSLDLGKSAMGILTGNFENISQIQTAVEKGGLIDNISELLNMGIKTAQDKGIIDKTIAKEIKSWKNNILNTITSGIEESLSAQTKSLDKLGGYCEKWNSYYKEQDFDNMEKMYKKIEKEREKIVPLENLINEMNRIDNLHNLIKNNGNNFEISANTMALAEIL